MPVSALTGKGLDTLMRAVLAADELWNRRIPTHALNQWLREAVDAHPPPAVAGRRIKLRYMTQSNARPPTFVLFCSRPKAVPNSYVRYLVNSLRETFDLGGVPIRLHLRKGANPYAKGNRGRMSDGRHRDVFLSSRAADPRRGAADAARALARARLARRGAGRERGAGRGARHAAVDLSRGELSRPWHGRDGPAELQPIYLTADHDNPNGAEVRFLVDGAELEDAASYARVVFVFDGRDEDAVSQARAAWQKAKAQGFSVSYWQQDAQGRWQQKA